LFQFGLFFSACLKDSVQKIKKLNGATWNGTYALPVLKTHFLPEDAIQFTDEISDVGAYKDSQVYMEYRKTAVSLKGQDILKPPSVNAGFKYSLDAAEQNLLEGGSVVMERDQIIEWPQQGANIDSMLFKSGKFHVQVDNSINHSLNLTVILLGNKPGNAVSQSIQLPWSGQNNQGGFDIDLSNVMADLTRGPKGYNQLRIRIRAIFTNTSGGKINGSDQLSCTFTANEFSWIRAHGRFNSRDILNHSDDLRLGALSADFTANNTVFKDARLKIKWSNSFGLPIDVNLNSLGFIQGDGSRKLISGTSKPYSAKPAGIEAGKPVPETDSLYLNSLNSNIANLVEDQPHYLFWNETLITRASSSPSNQTIWSESNCSVSISLELPLYFETKGITITASGDLPENWKSEASNMQWIVFRFKIRNELPLSLGIQAYFLDEQNNILDSLLSPYNELVPAASSDSLGNAIGAHEEFIDIKLERPKIVGITNARRIFMEARVSTALKQGKPIEKCKIKQGQGLYIKLGVHSSLNVYRKF
jgi:hypothetical protein